MGYLNKAAGVLRYFILSAVFFSFAGLFDCWIFTAEKTAENTTESVKDSKHEKSSVEKVASNNAGEIKPSAQSTDKSKALAPAKETSVKTEDTRGGKKTAATDSVKKPEGEKGKKIEFNTKEKKAEAAKEKKKQHKPGQWDVEKSPLRFWIEADKDKYFGGTGRVKLPSGWLPEDKVKIAVLTDSGELVGSKILWQSVGEYLEIIFDASAGAKVYQVYLSQETLPVIKQWEPESGLVMEVRRGLKLHAYDFNKAKEFWDKNTLLLTRNIVPKVFDGTIERMSPDNLLVKYRGHLNIDNAGDYYISTMSDDGSFVVVDGKLVISWGGSHNVWGGRYGEHKGKVTLTKGRHLFEYYNVFVDGRFCVAAGWQAPGKKGVRIIEENDFGKISYYHLVKAEAKEPLRYPVILSWWRKDSVVVTESTGDSFVEMNFSLLRTDHRADFKLFDKPKEIEWRFNNGYARSGIKVSTVMPAAMTEVTLEIGKDRKNAFQLKRTVNVMANWNTWEKWSGDRYRAVVKRFKKQDLDGVDLSGLLAVSALAVPVNNNSLAREVADRLSKLKELPLEYQQLPVVTSLIEALSAAGIRRYAQAKDIALKALAGAKTKKITGNYFTDLQLAYATLELGVWGRTGLVVDFLKTNSLIAQKDGTVSFAQSEQGKMLLADAYLLDDKVSDAVNILQAMSGKTDAAKDAKRKLKRRGKIESCEVWLAKGEFKDVVVGVLELRMDDPLELLNPESTLLLAKSYYALEEYDKAYIESIRLLKTELPAGAASGLYYQASLSALKTGRIAEAKKFKEILLKKYPQTYAGARAAELDIEEKK